MFQKKVTIKDNIICIEVSNEVGDINIGIAKDAPKPVIEKMIFESFKVNYKANSTKEVENYWDPQFKLIMNEIVNSIYSIGIGNLDPEKNFADYELVKEDD